MVSSGETFEICVFFLLGCNPCNQISFLEFNSFPLERNLELLAEITLRTLFATFELLIIYHTTIGFCLFICLGKSRFSTLPFPSPPPKTHLFSPPGATRN